MARVEFWLERVGKRIVTTELVLHVMRDEENRLGGTVRVSTESTVHAFSGTLELMSVFEELVPVGHVKTTSETAQPSSGEGATWTDGIS